MLQTQEHFKKVWLLHKVQQRLNFANSDEERTFDHFKSNGEFIQSHNRCKQELFLMGHNNLSHMHNDEYKAWLSLKVPEFDLKKVKPTKLTIPRHLDWRDFGVVTNIKHQGKCGACWAFSSLGAVESAHAIAGNSLLDLSEQQLVDCSTANMGCNGGDMTAALEYIKENGIMKEEDYPYVGSMGDCKYQQKDLIKIKSYGVVRPGEEYLARSVTTYGPNCVAIDSSPRSFQLYKSGIYHDPTVRDPQINHGVLCVGFGQFRTNDYWVIKNSWGERWGEGGFVSIARNKDNFLGISEMCCYPVV